MFFVYNRLKKLHITAWARSLKQVFLVLLWTLSSHTGVMVTTSQAAMMYSVTVSQCWLSTSSPRSSESTLHKEVYKGASKAEALTRPNYNFINIKEHKHSPVS